MVIQRGGALGARSRLSDDPLLCDEARVSISRG